MRLQLVASVVVLATTNAAHIETVGPIIGIFQQPSFSVNPACGGNCEYIAGSYVKWIESAGGRVVPLPYNASRPYLDTVFQGLNGLLLPGGSNVVSEAATYMVEKAIKANKDGEFFPVWGTCMGWEWLAQTVGGAGFLLDHNMDAENISLPLDLTPWAKESRLFSHMPSELLAAVTRRPLTFNNHMKGVTIQSFQKSAPLSSTFNLLSVNKDRLGTPYVSTLEGKDLPLYAVQWHPEKSVYEWGEREDGSAYEAIDHSPDAQALADYLAHFFLNETRKSTHVFKDAALRERSLIYNVSPVYSGPSYVTSYFFPPTPEEGVEVAGPVGEVEESRETVVATPSP